MTEEVLELIRSAIDTLVGFIQQVSPELWRIGVRQSYVVGIQSIVGLFACVTFTPILIKVTKFCYRQARDEHAEAIWDVLAGFALVALIVVSIMGPICLAEAVSRFVNPEYYAVTLLLDLFRVQ